MIQIKEKKIFRFKKKTKMKNLLVWLKEILSKSYLQTQEIFRQNFTQKITRPFDFEKSLIKMNKLVKIEKFHDLDNFLGKINC